MRILWRFVGEGLSAAPSSLPQSLSGCDSASNINSIYVSDSPPLAPMNVVPVLPPSLSVTLSRLKVYVPLAHFFSLSLKASPKESITFPQKTKNKTKQKNFHFHKFSPCKKAGKKFQFKQDILVAFGKTLGMMS